LGGLLLGAFFVGIVALLLAPEPPPPSIQTKHLKRGDMVLWVCARVTVVGVSYAQRTGWRAVYFMSDCDRPYRIESDENSYWRSV
jgi:hypothetical protein